MGGWVDRLRGWLIVNIPRDTRRTATDWCSPRHLSIDPPTMGTRPLSLARPTPTPPARAAPPAPSVADLKLQLIVQIVIRVRASEPPRMVCKGRWRGGQGRQGGGWGRRGESEGAQDDDGLINQASGAGHWAALVDADGDVENLTG